MKTTLGIAFVGLALMALSACTPKNEIQLKPLSPREIRAIQAGIQTGKFFDENGDQPTEECETPVFLGLNVKGTVSVPEDYNHPEGRHIQVAYYGRLQPNKEPVVFFNGGPASDSHSSAGIIENPIQVPQSYKLSFIYIDQRGTGCSDPFPSDPTPETVDRLTHYTSTEIVKDAEVIREKLLGQNTQWKIFGQSYGGLIVHRYALESPDSVLAAYAHGFSVMQDQVEWLTLRIQSQKRVSDLYFKQFPQDRNTILKLRRQIPEDLCFSEQGTVVCGPQVLDALTIFLGFSNNWGYLHSWVTRLADDESGLNKENLIKFVRTYVYGVYASGGLAGSVISISEISGGVSDTEACGIAHERLKASGEDVEAWPIDECRLLQGLQNDQWNELLKNVKPLKMMTPALVKQALLSHPELPFYLYSGEKDVFVPIETFQEEISALGTRIQYRQFPNSGHEGFYTEPQVWQDLLSPH